MDRDETGASEAMKKLHEANNDKDSYRSPAGQQAVRGDGTQHEKLRRSTHRFCMLGKKKPHACTAVCMTH